MFQLRVQFCLIILPLNDNNKNNKQLCFCAAYLLRPAPAAQSPLEQIRWTAVSGRFWITTKQFSRI